MADTRAHRFTFQSLVSALKRNGLITVLQEYHRFRLAFHLKRPVVLYNPRFLTNRFTKAFHLKRCSQPHLKAYLRRTRLKRP
jgi:hypothetical protein